MMLALVLLCQALVAVYSGDPNLIPRSIILNPQSGGKSGNPGLTLRISSKGLNYANGVAANLLNTEIRNVRIPDFEKSISRGNLRAWNIRITHFDPPTYGFTLSGPSRIGWGLNGGTISITGNWKGEKRVTFIKIKGDGTVSATASNLRISVSANFLKNSRGKPLMSGVSCSAHIGSLSLKIRGGVVGWLLNLFRGKIADKLKPSLQTEICNQAKKFVERDVNSKLNTFPTIVSLSRSFKLDYKLTENPKVDANGIESSHKGEVSYLGQGGTSFYPHNLATTSSNAKMLYFFGSDYILNSFLSSAHRNQKINYTLDEDNMPEIARYLRTSCSDFCLGTLFPDVSTEYPGAKGSLGFQTVRDPTIFFTNGKATVNAWGKIFLHLHQPSRPNIEILRTNVSLSADLVPRISSDFRKVSGSMKINNLRVSEVESPIEDLSEMPLQGLVDLATGTLEQLANKEAAKGIPIPLTSGVRIRNAQVRMLPRTMELSADVTYSG